MLAIKVDTQTRHDTDDMMMDKVCLFFSFALSPMAGTSKLISQEGELIDVSNRLSRSKSQRGQPSPAATVCIQRCTTLGFRNIGFIPVDTYSHCKSVALR